MKAKTNNRHKYYLIVGSTIVKTGTTDDLGKREIEHLQKCGSNIVQVGVITTREAALRWER